MDRTQRGIRIPDKLWEDLRRIARVTGVSTNDVCRLGLETFASQQRQDPQIGRLLLELEKRDQQVEPNGTD